MSIVTLEQREGAGILKSEEYLGADGGVGGGLEIRDWCVLRKTSEGGLDEMTCLDNYKNGCAIINRYESRILTAPP